MKEKSFKIREREYDAILNMAEKEAGQFIKGLCGYAFVGIPFETKDAKIASAYAYAKTAFDVSAASRENGRKGGLLVAERMRELKSIERNQGNGDPVSMLLKGIVMSSSEEKSERDRLRGRGDGADNHAAEKRVNLRDEPAVLWVAGVRRRRADRGGKLPKEYIARLAEVFAEVHSVLKDDGTLWLNIADSYAAAERLGWEYIGVEINPNYCEKAQKRIERTEPVQRFKTVANA